MSFRPTVRLSLCLMALIGCLFVAGAIAAPERPWKTVAADKFGVEFDIPSAWDIQFSGETFVASPKRGGLTFLLTGYGSDGLSSGELFAKFSNEIEMQTEEAPEHLGDLNGFDAWLGGGSATVDGADVLVLAVALTGEDRNIVGYFFCERSLVDRYQDLMLRMLRRIRPIGEAAGE
jgi:hypothetical protein